MSWVHPVGFTTSERTQIFGQKWTQLTPVDTCSNQNPIRFPTLRILNTFHPLIFFHPQKKSTGKSPPQAVCKKKCSGQLSPSATAAGRIHLVMALCYMTSSVGELLLRTLQVGSAVFGPVVGFCSSSQKKRYGALNVGGGKSWGVI